MYPTPPLKYARSKSTVPLVGILMSNGMYPPSKSANKPEAKL